MREKIAVAAMAVATCIRLAAGGDLYGIVNHANTGMPLRDVWVTFKIRKELSSLTNEQGGYGFYSLPVRRMANRDTVRAGGSRMAGADRLEFAAQKNAPVTIRIMTVSGSTVRTVLRNSLLSPGSYLSNLGSPNMSIANT